MKVTTTSRGVSFLTPQGDEKHEQAQITTLVEALGGVVYTLGTRRQRFCPVCGAPTDQATRQTPGLGDLAVFLPPAPRLRAAPGARPAWIFLWIEVKGRGGALSPEQVTFREINERARVQHLVGGIDEFMRWLTAGGWIRS